jgi:hypothetical protein
MSDDTPPEVDQATKDAARADVLEAIKTMRLGADMLRKGFTGTMTLEQLAPIVADWIDGEAAVMGEMEPFADLINAQVSKKTGETTALLRLGYKPDGNLELRGDTSGNALRVLDLLAESYPEESPT